MVHNLIDCATADAIEHINIIIYEIVDKEIEGNLKQEIFNYLNNHNIKSQQLLLDNKDNSNGIFFTWSF